MHILKLNTEKFRFDPSKGFDDSELNNTGKQISRERSLEIEKLVKPELEKAFQKLKERFPKVQVQSD